MSTLKVVDHFDKEQVNTVFGYCRECQEILTNCISRTIPFEIFALCLSFYQSERFSMCSENATISNNTEVASDFKAKHTGYYRLTSRYINCYAHGSFWIRSASGVKSVEWRFRVIRQCPMRIGVTSETSREDTSTVLDISGRHRFHSLSYLGVCESHRRRQRACDFQEEIFVEGDIIVMSIDMEAATIKFEVVNKYGRSVLATDTSRINLCDDYRMAVYLMNITPFLKYKTAAKWRNNGALRLESFEMSR